TNSLMQIPEDKLCKGYESQSLYRVWLNFDFASSQGDYSHLISTSSLLSDLQRLLQAGLGGLRYFFLQIMILLANDRFLGGLSIWHTCWRFCKQQFQDVPFVGRRQSIRRPSLLGPHRRLKNQ